MRRDLPSGTVTFLFTDIEGSTKLLHELGAGYAQALAGHRRLLRQAFTRLGGVEVDTQGDAFFVAFASAREAVAAARDAQEALAAGPIKVRMGLHTGEPELTGEGYVGADVHKGARIAAAGHGGQVLLSKETRDRIAGEPGEVAAEVTDLGEHRVKDFAEPVWIFQLGVTRFPPLKTISNTNLPRPASSFVGREREVAEVAALLTDGARLLTLTGPGGSGKTRLAIEAAADLVPEFKAGVFWVGLAAFRDPSLVTETIGQTLGAKDGLAEHVGERELLLLLDNLEQVVEAAPELAALVEACPNLRVLTTSRELLRVRGEVEYPVPSLAHPEAIELFCVRSRLEADGTIAELCLHLDNLPLAVELAAARASVLSPAQILERLSKRLDLLKGGRDADPRQQTLRATIEWSYELLDEEERRLFARLAVFAGGCTLEAAEEVAKAGLDTLQSLVDQSLVRHGNERFWMLETIAEYAVERLEDSGEAEEMTRRHAEHFLALAEEAEPNLRGSPGEWLKRLEREHDNLRAALERFGGSGETQLALQMVGALWPFWYQRGHLEEGRRRLESALAADKRPTAARAKALDGAAAVTVDSGDAATARLRAEEGLALHRTLGDAWGTAHSGFLLGFAVAAEGDLAASRQIFEESVRRFRELGDDHYTLLSTLNLADTYHDLGDVERARALHEDNLLRARAVGNQRIAANSLGSMARIAVGESRVEDALPMLKESLAIARDLGDLGFIPRHLSLFARALALEGRATPAAQLLSIAIALRDEIGGPGESWVGETNEETLATVRAQLDEGAFAEAWEQGRALTADEAIALALESSD